MKVKRVFPELSIIIGVVILLLGLPVLSLHKTRQLSRELSEIKDYVKKLPPPPSFRQLPHPQMEDVKEIPVKIDLKRGDRK